MPCPLAAGMRRAADAVGAERGLQAGDVGGGAQRGIRVNGAGEGGPRLITVVSADELGGGRLQRLGGHQRPAGVGVTLRGREQPGGVVVEQAAAVQRGRRAVRDRGSGRERGGAARDGISRAQVRDPRGEPGGVGEQVLDLHEFFGIGPERAGEYGKRLARAAVVFAIKAAGQCQRADQAAPDLLGVRISAQSAADRGPQAALPRIHLPIASRQSAGATPSSPAATSQPMSEAVGRWCPSIIR